MSAKYKGAFCEAKIHTVMKDVKVRVTYKKGGQQTVSDDQIIGEIRVGNTVEIKSSDPKIESGEATVTKIQDCSKYTVVFDDGDIATLRRSALCRQSGKHFNACDTLDQLPLTHPEQRGSSKRTKAQDEYESDDDEYAIGKVVCVENTDTKKKNAKESYFPALVVAPRAQESAKIHIKTEYLVRSFKDGRYYTVPKKEVSEFTKETEQKSDSAAVAAAREFLDKNVLPTHWDREVLIDSASLSDQELSDSSDDEPNEVKDRFFAQLLEFMEKRNSPLNKGPSITNRDVDLYRLYYSVEKLGGYANVTKIRNWKAIAKRLGFTPTDAIVKLVKHSYRKFLLAFEEAVTKGIEELPPRANRDKARSSSTRSGSVASPKVVEKTSKKSIEKPTTSSAADDSENTSESTKITSTRKLSTASTKSKIVEEVKKEIKEEKVVVKKEKSLSKDEDPPSTSPPSTAKKEKTKKKPPEAKKSVKKEEPVEKKEIAISKSQAPSGPSIADDVPIDIDDRLKVYYRGSSDYEAKVLEISSQDGKAIYRVHYKGWNARYDEWIHRESIAENLTKDEMKKKSTTNPTKTSSATTSSNTSTNVPSTPTTAQKGKRARARADTTASSRSTTPLSNTSSKTKVAQKRPIRSTPTSKKPAIEDNSSESDEPIKKPEKKEKLEEKPVIKTESEIKNEPKVKEIKKEEKVEPKSDDEKSTRSSKSSKFDIKSKLKQRDSSRSSLNSTDSDSSHSVPSDVPNSSKSAYTSENESNEPEKNAKQTDGKKSSFRFDEETSDTKNPTILSSFFEKTIPVEKEKPADKPSEIFVAKKPTNIFQEKKAAAAAAKQIDTKMGRFSQLEKSKETAKSNVKSKDVKESKESDVYEFNDMEETPPPPASSASVKKESPSEPQNKKQQLAQQRKQARSIQKEEPPQMEDIESMIKTSMISFPTNKKAKKSPAKEEKIQPQSSIIASRTSVIAEKIPEIPVTPVIQRRTPQNKPESTFDVLRKSPSFNMPMGSEDFSSPSTQKSPNLISPTPSSSSSSTSLITAGPVKFGTNTFETHELLKPIMVPSKEEEKPELEAFKKILDPSFDIPVKPEKPTSIADKLLKAISQVDNSYEIKKEEPLVKSEQAKATTPTIKSPPPTSAKLSKKDQKEIPFESAITSLQPPPPTQTTTTTQSLIESIKKPADDSDTDSDRLVIEDEITPEIQPPVEKKKMGVLESIMLQDDVPYKTNSSTKESEKKEGEQQSESMSLLLCEETIPGSPAPASVKDPLSEIGRSPTSTSGNFVQPSSIAQSASNYPMKYSASHSNIKALPMDIDSEAGIEAAHGDILRDKLKAALDRGSATSSGNNTNNNSDDDDQSENEKNCKSYLFLIGKKKIDKIFI